MSKSDRWNSTGLRDIAVGDLSAEEGGKDETQYCDDGKYDCVLITRPRNRKITQRAQQVGVKGERAHYEKEGQKDT